MLGKPGITHKFVKGLSGYPGAKIYRKSGTWKHWHSDSAIVEDGPYRYILVALAANPKGAKWLEHLARAAHQVVVPRRIALAKNPLPPLGR